MQNISGFAFRNNIDLRNSKDDSGPWKNKEPVVFTLDRSQHPKSVELRSSCAPLEIFLIRCSPDWDHHREKGIHYSALQSTLVDLWAGTAMGVGALIRSMMNRLTANSSLPRGPAVKLASLAGRRCLLGCRFARGGPAPPLCLSGDESWAGVFVWGRGVNGT